MKSRNARRIAVWILLIALILCILIGGVLLYFAFRTYDTVSYDIQDYVRVSDRFSQAPALDDLGEYSELSFKHLHREQYIFQSDAYILRAKYDEENFLNQQKQIADVFSFEETVTDYGEQTRKLTPQFRLDTFDFKLISLDIYDGFYPKCMIFLGASEEANEIAYVFFYDIDLDYIDGSFEEFLITECGWEPRHTDD